MSDETVDEWEEWHIDIREAVRDGAQVTLLGMMAHLLVFMAKRLSRIERSLER
jgi:hypothetical protein